MQSDPLQQLKPLHLPPDPSWWPPAIGWWVLLLVLIILTAWTVYSMTKFFRAMRPVRHGKYLLSDLYTSLKLGHISDEDFVHLSNQLIKRVLVPGLGKIKYSKLSGSQWLAELDSISGSTNFSQGAGKVLGNERFTENFSVDCDKLYLALNQLLKCIRP